MLELDENHGRVDDRAVVAQRVGLSEETVRQVAKRFVATGGDVEATITRKQRLRPPVPPVVTGEVEARLIKLACSTPPPGYTRWSLRLLEKHVALLDDVPDLDHPAARQRRVRRPDGRRAGRLRPTLRPDPAGVVF